MPLFAIAFCLVAASAGRSDDRPQSTDKPATTQASGIAAEFKAIKQEAEAKLNKLYGTVAKEYDGAKSEDAREAIQKRASHDAALIYEPAAEKLMTEIRRNPADPGAVEALVWIVSSRSSAKVGIEAVEYLQKHHLVKKPTIELPYRMKRAPMSWTEPLLRAQLASPELPPADRPRLLLALAMVEQTYAQFPELLANMTPSQLAHVNEIYGAETIAKYRTIDVANAEAEAIKLYSELGEKYGSETLVGNITFGSLAKSSIFEIQNLSIGKAAPDISGEDTDGSKFKLSDYKGKVVMLSFWGTWCGPCMALVPHEREIATHFKDKKFALIGVNSDVDKAKLKSAMDREKITWRSFWCGPKGLEGEIPSSWNVNGWPTIYVLDHQGVIRAKQAMGKALDQVLEKLVAEAEASGGK
jgi:thiol-disulfide isomerase/thioredoxin